MCWSATASVAMVAAGGAATAVTLVRGEPRAIWVTMAYFTLMEALQATGYAVVDQCGTTANQVLTVLSYLHIAFQPLFINAFAMAIAPAPVPRRTARAVWVLSGLAALLLVARLLPFETLGQCQPGEILCGPAFCLVSGNWHIAWELPLNAGPGLLGLSVQFPAYLLAVFVLPLVYGAWRFVVFHAVAGPILATWLTQDPNEMPAVWCLFSIGIILIGLSPFIRHRVMGAYASVPA